MEEGERTFQPETEKPAHFFHASAQHGIESLEPRAKSYRNAEEGSVVFATPDRAYASMFMVEGDDSWVHICSFDGVHCMVISDRQRFKELDHGGSLYTMGNESFRNNNQESPSGQEWTSKEAVPIASEKIYPSALEAMLGNDVQVYFVDQDTYSAIQMAEDFGLDILRITESENQKRGQHVRELTTDRV